MKYIHYADEAERLAADGAALTCEVNLFYDQNLYGILGNVSEITSDEKIMGGNWFTLPSEINLDKKYTLPDPRVGFRVVMERFY